MRHGSRRVLLALALAAFAASATAHQPAPERPLLILGALEAEAEPVRLALAEARPDAALGLPCVVGTLGGRSVVVGVTGVGKVNAAMTTALLIERFSPAAVLFTGVAGGLDADLVPGDVVVGERLVQHDLVNHTEAGAVPRSVRNPVTGVMNPLALEAAAELLAAARASAADVALEAIAPARSPRVAFGTIATGDSFVGAQAKRAELRAAGAQAVEMEGAAVAQVCLQLGVPLLVVRGVSDRAGQQAASEARLHMQAAARNAAALTLAVARRLAAAQPAAVAPAVAPAVPSP